MSAPDRWYGEPVARFTAMAENGEGCDQAHFRMWCRIAAEEIGHAQGALLRIAEGNLGPSPWQANYESIRKAARDALTAQGMSCLHEAGTAEPRSGGSPVPSGDAPNG